MSVVSPQKAIFAHARSTARTRATCADYARYEALKAEWVANNPEATTEQYEAALKVIAKACGV